MFTRKIAGIATLALAVALTTVSASAATPPSIETATRSAVAIPLEEAQMVDPGSASISFQGEVNAAEGMRLTPKIDEEGNQYYETEDGMRVYISTAGNVDAESYTISIK